LAVSPADRIGYAQDVALVLESVGVRPSAFPRATPPHTHVYRPTMVGRTEDLHTLDALVERCAAGRGGRCFIGGESGMGKTRLAMELAGRARRRGLRVVTSSCAPLEVGARAPVSGDTPPLHPFRAFLTMVADRARQHGPELADRWLGERAKVLAACEPAVATLPGHEQYREPPAVPADVARARLIAALEQTLEVVALEGPLLLVIDDWQWADTLSVEVLESLTDAFFARVPLLVLGTYRTEEIDRDAAARLRGLANSHMLLAPLDRAAVRQMTSEMLAYPDVPDQLVGLLARESEGNPFFLNQYVQLAADEGWLARDGLGKWRVTDPGTLQLASSAEVRVPASLRAVLDRRLAIVSSAARTLAGFVAVLGRNVDADLLREIPGLAPDEIPAAVDELFAHKILEHAGSSFRFAHDKLREAAYETIPKDQIPTAHRSAALALERDMAGRIDRGATGDQIGSAAALALHWSMAGDLTRERTYRATAGMEAFRLGAYEDAVTHLSRCLALPAVDRDATADLALERQLAEAYFGLGDVRACRRHLEALVEMARMPLPKGGGAVAVTAIGDAARYFGGRAATLFGGAPPAALRRRYIETARAYERLAHVLYFENESIGVASCSLRALAAAARVGASPELSRAYANLSVAAGLIPLRPLARLLKWRASAVAAEVGDRAAAAWARELEGVYDAGVGRWHNARRALEDAGEAWRSLGDRRRREECLTLLGMALFQAGDTGAAAGMRTELLRMSEGPGHEQTRGWALIGQAEDRLHEGQPREALDALGTAQSLGDAVQRAEQLWMLGLRSRAFLAVGDAAQAQGTLDQALALSRQVMPVAFYVLEGYAAMAEVAVHLLVSPAVTSAQDPLKQARDAVAKLVRFAQVFPIAGSRAHFWRARLLRATGARRRAARHERLALSRAVALERHHDVALVQRHLAAGG
jgi:tetratricopeptide (TPR) repeat protein